jgi:hypothetical protein
MFRVSIAATILASVIASAMLAQSQEMPPGKSFRDQGGGVGLGFGLNYAAYPKVFVFQEWLVQDELKVTVAQKKQAKQLMLDSAKVSKRVTEEYNDAVKSLGDQPDRQALKELRERRSAHFYAAADRVEEGLKKLLDRRQFTRLGQIQYQAEGPAIFRRPEVQERLNLAPEQVEQVLAIVSLGERELSRASLVQDDVIPDPRLLTLEQLRASRETVAYKGAIKKVRESAVNISKETMRMVFKVLSKGQRERYQRMVGEPFDFKKSWEPPTPKPSDSKQETKAP